MFKIAILLVFGIVGVYAGSLSQPASIDSDYMKWLEEKDKMFEERLKKLEEKEQMFGERDKMFEERVRKIESKEHIFEERVKKIEERGIYGINNYHHEI